MSNPRLRAKLAFLALALLTGPALMLLAELFTRLLTPHLDPLAVFISSPQLRSDTQGETTSGMFEFDPLLTWRLRANLRDTWWDFTPVTTNAAHLRMTRQLSAKSGTRIVMFGDSVTFGYRVPVAHDRQRPGHFDHQEKTYPQLVEELLREQYPDEKIEVLPLACPGYTSGQGLAWLRREIAELRPDIVTACFGWNDVRAAGMPDSATFPQTRTQAAVRAMMGRSQLLLHLAASARQKSSIGPAPAPQPRSSESEYVAHFTNMATLCREHGAWLGILLPVYRDPNTPGDYPEMKGHIGDPAEAHRIASYRDALRVSAGAAKIPTLEIPELTEHGWPQNAGLFGERIHPNAAGHRLIAERLVEFIPLPFTEKQRTP